MAYGYPANETRLKEKSDYGVRVAKYGYDATTCNDCDLLFNSNWPIIQIAKMVDISSHDPKLIGSTEYPEVTTEEPWELNTEYDKVIAGVDKANVYTKAHVRRYQYEVITMGTYELHEFYQIDLYGFSHNLGYVPMFYSEMDFNGQNQSENRVILTNIDVTTDVDYPYVSAASSYRGGTSDYGIKSRAFGASKMRDSDPSTIGINTSVQSKQIMAVKTQDTIDEEGWVEEWGENPIMTCVYYPPYSDGEPIMDADTFEYYALGASIFACLANDGSFSAGGSMGAGVTSTNAKNNLDVGMGSVYFRVPVIPIGTSTIYGARLSQYAWGDQSLVVVRSPMVSPDMYYTEVVAPT